MWFPNKGFENYHVRKGRENTKFCKKPRRWIIKIFLGNSFLFILENPSPFYELQTFESSKVTLWRIHKWCINIYKCGPHTFPAFWLLSQNISRLPSPCFWKYHLNLLYKSAYALCYNSEITIYVFILSIK